MALRVGVLGATGRMGRRVIHHVAQAPDLELAAALGREASPLLGVDAGHLAGTDATGVAVTPLSTDAIGACDVVVDFSLPAGLQAALPLLQGKPLVSGVTGVDARITAALHEVAEHGPTLWTSNFSTGVHVLADAVGRAAAALPDYDVEIVEAHHRRKVDAPSGTALLLGSAAAHGRGLDLESCRVDGRSGRSPRSHGEIGFHAIRGGDVVGEHTVWLAGDGERLLLGHVASSRDTFALGALRAARWLVKQDAGMYTMRDVLGLASCG